MKRMQRVFGDLDALRFVDGRLDEERRAAFQSHLADHPEEAERVALWCRQNDTIRAAFAGVAMEPVPVALRLGKLAPPPRPLPSRLPHALPARDPGAIRPTAAPAADVAYLSGGGVRSRRSTLSRYRVPLSAFALMVVAALIVTIAHGLMPASVALERAASQRAPEAESVLVSRATDAFETYATDLLHSVEFAASQTVPLGHWLRRRIGLPVPVPDLSGRGWQLLGGRLVPGAVGPGAFLVYENGTGERLGLFAQRSLPDFTSQGTAIVALGDDQSAMTWSDGSLSYVVTGRQTVDWMSRNGEAIRTIVAATR